jgi:hypothetical protein
VLQRQRRQVTDMPIEEQGVRHDEERPRASRLHRGKGALELVSANFCHIDQPNPVSSKEPRHGVDF